MNKYFRNNLILRISFFIVALFIFESCTGTENIQKQSISATFKYNKNNIIPNPVSIQFTKGIFLITPETNIYVDPNSDEAMRTGQFLSELFNTSTGFSIKVIKSGIVPTKGSFYLTTLNTDSSLGEEGYELKVTDDFVKLSAYKPAGLFRGIQTIRQMLPPLIESSNVQPGPWILPECNIRDYPRFQWRGAMLDVARHFFSVKDVKRYIDLLAYYKLNRLHLHLADDQGWRIMINSWPNLAIYGGSTEVDGGKGGYYTQEEYKDIIDYAQSRYITIIPEIDMPGHINAALASYPELNCNGQSPSLYTGTHVGFSSLCIDKEVTYKFLDDVIGELSELTPGPYIHIGGDEAHSTPKDEYIKFVNRVKDIVKKHNKIMIGWEEIAQADLHPGTVVQYWTNSKYAKMAVEKNLKLIMSPGPKMYIDMKYTTLTRIGQTWAALIDVKDSYNWDPANLEVGITDNNILGVEAPLWTETITSISDIEYMAFPRIASYAEMGWSPSGRNWEEYKSRLAAQKQKWEAMKISFYHSQDVPWE